MFLSTPHFLALFAAPFLGLDFQHTTSVAVSSTSSGNSTVILSSSDANAPQQCGGLLRNAALNKDGTVKPESAPQLGPIRTELGGGLGDIFASKVVALAPFLSSSVRATPHPKGEDDLRMFRCTDRQNRENLSEYGRSVLAQAKGTMESLKCEERGWATLQCLASGSVLGWNVYVAELLGFVSNCFFSSEIAPARLPFFLLGFAILVRSAEQDRLVEHDLAAYVAVKDQVY